MTWLKLDDRFDEHPKFVGLSDKALALWLKGLAYCSRHLTDGHIPKAVLRRLDGTPKAAKELVAAGLWEEWADYPDEYLVHNYLVHQRSRQTVEAQRSAGAARAARHRVSRGPTNAVSNAVTERARPPTEVELETREPEDLEIEEVTGGLGVEAQIRNLSQHLRLPKDVDEL